MVARLKVGRYARRVTLPSEREPADPEPTNSAVAVLGADGEVDEVLDRCTEILAAGGNVVLPTDTVYGVAAAAHHPEAVAGLAVLKGRSGGQPLAVLVADAAQALVLTESVSGQVRRWMDDHWPGPLTLVLRRSKEAGRMSLGGDEATIGVRCPDHGFVRALAARVGPLATTSANRHGEPTPVTAQEAAAALTAPVDLVVDGGPAGTVASTVVDVTTHTPKVLRTGALAPGVLGL